MELQIVNGKQSMDSRDIAKLTGKNHADVCRDIRSMLDGLEIGESNFASSCLFISIMLAYIYFI